MKERFLRSFGSYISYISSIYAYSSKDDGTDIIVDEKKSRTGNDCFTQDQMPLKAYDFLKEQVN